MSGATGRGEAKMSDGKSMSVHESEISALKEKLQLNGYFSKLAREGIRPDYGYPEKNSVGDWEIPFER